MSYILEIEEDQNGDQFVVFPDEIMEVPRDVREQARRGVVVRPDQLDVSVRPDIARAARQ